MQQASKEEEKGRKQACKGQKNPPTLIFTLALSNIHLGENNIVEY